QAILTFSSDRKNGNLVVLDRFGSRETVDPDVFEMLSQRPCTLRKLSLRDNQEEDTSWHNPSAGMTQKHHFHPLIVSLAHFEVVGRIEIDKRETVHAALNFQCVAVHHID